MATVLFTEVQKLRQNWLWFLVLIIPAVIILGTLSYQFFTGEMLGDKPMSNLSLSVLAVMYLVPMLFILSRIKMQTIIDSEKISYGWNIPNKELNEISLSEIKELSIIEYKFVGYGYEFTKRYGIVYNVAGNKGLQIIKKSGDMILLGTRKAKELDDIIKRVKTDLIF